ncbi:MAG: argininosuccinate lyase [Candidatus Hadarchaeales archaeon]
MEKLSENPSLRKGRFEKEIDAQAATYTSSLKDDIRIFRPTVQVNIAHAIMLLDQGIISKNDASGILKALLSLNEKDPSTLEMPPELEDIHMVIEEFVAKEAGESGQKLHTGKSRNDQVVAAIKIALRKELVEVCESISSLINSLVAQAEKNLTTVMPGYTHTQVAEPTTFAHFLSAYSFCFLRDLRRFEATFEFLNSCPMGACALAGTSLPVNRGEVANLLGFKRIDENTMDAVGSRDFILHAMSALSIAMVNLSRLAEEVILMASSEFGMLELPDEFSSTSSIMPQKKNPVVAEIVRAKASRVIGNLTSALSLLKSLPQAYNLDYQELTPLLWSTVDETKAAFAIMAKMFEKLNPKPEVMEAKASEGFSAATELASELVRSGVPFREAHSIVGRVVLNATKSGKKMAEITPEDITRAAEEVCGKKVEISPERLSEVLDVKKVVAMRSLPGGPSQKSVSQQLKEIKNELKNYSKILEKRKKALKNAESDLLKKARERMK